jgi:subtilase family protein/fervidolysin-like protein
MSLVVHRFALRSIVGVHALACFLLFSSTGALRAADSLSWNAEKGRVTGDVQNWDLQVLLENVAAATGWEIYVEPRTRHRASTKFKDRPPGDALRMLLGNLSYALLPQTNGPARLYVFRNTKSDATQLVRARRKSSKLDKELIVTMKPGSKLDEKALGGKVTGKIDKLNAYRLEFKDAEAAEEARKKLEQDENVDLVDSNYAISRPPDGEALSLSSIPGLDLKIRPNQAGDGPIIGLLDTSVQKMGGARDGFYLPTISIAGEATAYSDMPTHGTAMSEAILRGLSMLKDGGDVSGTRILPVDIYGDAPYASTFQLVQGLMEALGQGANIVNMSLGSEGGNALMHRIIQEAYAKGVLFFGAAGNEPTTAPTYPAAYPEVLAVTAVGRNGEIAPYANHGNFVDLGAPGSVVVPFNGQSFVVMGTSPSTAWASGLAGSLFAAGLESSSIAGKLQSLMAVPLPPLPSK